MQLCWKAEVFYGWLVVFLWKDGMCHRAKIRHSFSLQKRNKVILVRMALERDLLPFLKCLHQNILVLHTDLVKSHFQPPVSWMLQSVFSRVWYNLNGSRLSGTSPVTFFSYIIGMQDQWWKYPCLFVGWGGGAWTTLRETLEWTIQIWTKVQSTSTENNRKGFLKKHVNRVNKKEADPVRQNEGTGVEGAD